MHQHALLPVGALAVATAEAGSPPRAAGCPAPSGSILEAARAAAVPSASGSPALPAAPSSITQGAENESFLPKPRDRAETTGICSPPSARDSKDVYPPETGVPWVRGGDPEGRLPPAVLRKGLPLSDLVLTLTGVAATPRPFAPAVRERTDDAMALFGAPKS